MTNDFFLAISWWFQTAWRFMTSFYFPGTNVTPAGMFLFAACAVIGFRFLERLLNSTPSASQSKGGNNEKDS